MNILKSFFGSGQIGNIGGVEYFCLQCDSLEKKGVLRSGGLDECRLRLVCQAGDLRLFGLCCQGFNRDGLSLVQPFLSSDFFIFNGI